MVALACFSFRIDRTEENQSRCKTAAPTDPIITSLYDVFDELEIPIALKSGVQVAELRDNRVFMGEHFHV